MKNSDKKSDLKKFLQRPTPSPKPAPKPQNQSLIDFQSYNQYQNKCGLCLIPLQQKQKLHCGMCKVNYCHTHIRKIRRTKTKDVRVCDNCEDKTLYDTIMKHEMANEETLSTQEEILKLKFEEVRGNVGVKEEVFGQVLEKNILVKSRLDEMRGEGEKRVEGLEEVLRGIQGEEEKVQGEIKNIEAKLSEEERWDQKDKEIEQEQRKLNEIQQKIKNTDQQHKQLTQELSSINNKVQQQKEKLALKRKKDQQQLKKQQQQKRRLEEERKQQQERIEKQKKLEEEKIVREKQLEHQRQIQELKKEYERKLEEQKKLEDEREAIRVRQAAERQRELNKIKQKLKEEQQFRERLNIRRQEQRIQKQRVQNQRIEMQRIQNERIENERIENERIENERIQKQRIQSQRKQVQRKQKEQEQLKALKQQRAKQQQQILNQNQNNTKAQSKDEQNISPNQHSISAPQQPLQNNEQFTEQQLDIIPPETTQLPNQDEQQPPSNQSDSVHRKSNSPSDSSNPILNKSQASKKSAIISEDIKSAKNPSEPSRSHSNSIVNPHQSFASQSKASVVSNKSIHDKYTKQEYQKFKRIDETHPNFALSRLIEHHKQYIKTFIQTQSKRSDYARFQLAKGLLKDKRREETLKKPTMVELMSTLSTVQLSMEQLTAQFQLQKQQEQQFRDMEERCYPSNFEEDYNILLIQKKRIEKEIGHLDKQAEVVQEAIVKKQEMLESEYVEWETRQRNKISRMSFVKQESKCLMF